MRRRVLGYSGPHGTNLMFYMRNVKGTTADERKKTRVYPLQGAGKRTLLRVICAFFKFCPENKWGSMEAAAGWKHVECHGH
mmetsp:Transcript_14460/g.59011  ORF Transcript_14460/g.59011 Transcript_14460/m.59011 type:complete len:81 (+) Transcript_14460:2317-2559(+)